MNTENIKELWKRAFGDTEQYMDYYFSKKLPVSRLFLEQEKNELVSMAFFTPYTVKYKGEMCESYYIVGVATEEKNRGRHKMTNLLHRAMEECKKNEVPLVFLCPENPKVYRSLGFVPAYWRKTTYITNTEPEFGFAVGKNAENRSSEWQICAWSELDMQKKEQVSAFANEMLEKEKFDLYIERSTAYYENISLEMKALYGNLFTIWSSSGEICAIANLICEDDTYQITEFIVRRECAKKTVQELLFYLNIDFLQIDDSYFLGELSGEGITVKKQEKPYIMYRMLSGESSDIRCYINDIT